MSRLSITTDPEWLHNAHAGELLVSEFMEPLELDAATLASALDVPTSRVEQAVKGKSPIDADLDLRLSRYFGLSEGFFLRLQNQHDLLEAKRALNGDLERIVPRAA